MSGITRYAVIETALCVGSNLLEGEVFMVMATDHDRELAALREENSDALAVNRTLNQQMDALREELAAHKYKSELYDEVWPKATGLGFMNITMALAEIPRLQQRLAAAEQRNAAIVGKVTSCKECGSNDLFWFAQNTVPNGIQQNRLNTHDVECVFVLGCNDCSETLKLVSADKIAEQMTATLKPTESGASE